MTTTIKPKKAFEVARDAALEAGKLLERYQKKLSKLEVQVKESQGVVSAADKEAEALIIKRLKKSFPKSSFLAEESSFETGDSSSAQKQYVKKQKSCWIIDPLDGTTNFLNGMNYYGVCIALFEYGKPVMGLVYQPETQRAWVGLEGQGAFVYKSLSENKKKRLSSPQQTKKKIRDSLFVTGFASEKGVFKADEVERFKRILQNARGVRRMGSAALDMCYSAEGVFDGFWEVELSAWDVAASAIICLESGLKVTDFDGRKFNPFQESIIVASSSLAPKLRKELRL